MLVLKVLLDSDFIVLFQTNTHLNLAPPYKGSFSEGAAEMRGAAWGAVWVGLALWALLGPVQGGRHMDKLAEKKLCADPECNHPISIAEALQDYIAPDCRFLHIQRGQVVYIFSKLKGRGRLFWGGSVQGDYYGEQPARLGYFPSSVVRENRYLKPGKTEKWDFYCQ
ncbi:melanoma-derived growth regulatory protein isoform X2 [Paroedura picta]|uniref:melanoma-derived growth regulatory protein isoform X2 n=1 Tax=Paroedura picta TaxID=143630 RepID=UPI004055C04F